ncbi:MAG TPA: rhomboid family intramembrane serine protease [Nitrospirota bacterium]|nr:rhomboid family intramembrane serine protease [Nitrospirota bacterium]
MIPLRDINPTERFAVISFILIILNVIVFIYEVTLGSVAGEGFVNAFALVPANLLTHAPRTPQVIPAVATLFTSMFLHGGLLHLAGNMLYLWIFGNNVEDAMGRIRFVIFYLLCGVTAACAHALANRDSMIPMLGASGAISGVLGAYLLLYPRARVVTIVFFGFYIRTVEISAMVVFGFWFVIQFLNVLITSSSRGGVAWYAHVAGFIAGFFLIGLFKRKDVPFWGGRGSEYP